MIKDFIAYLMDQGEALRAAKEASIVTDAAGREVWLGGGDSDPRLLKKILDAPIAYTFRTLATLPGLLDFATEWSAGAPQTAPPKIPMPGFLVQPRKVVLCTGWEADGQKTAIACVEHSADPFPLDRYMDPEEFSTMLRGRAVSGEGREDLLRRLAEVSVAQVKSVTRLAMKASVTISLGGKDSEAEGKVELPTAVTLKLRRTFPEIEQPEGEYVLRVRVRDHEAEFALVDAGGGAWEHDACQALREYLADEVQKRELAVGIW